MDAQDVDQTIKRARRSTIGDAIRRSAARNPESDAVIFGEDLPRNAAGKILKRELRG